MIPYKAQAHIHSLDGEMDEISVLEKVGDPHSHGEKRSRLQGRFQSLCLPRQT